MPLHITGLPSTIIPVRDWDEAIAFYSGKLGFDVIADVPFGDGERWVEVAPPSGGHAIAMGRPPEGSPVGVMTGIIVETSDIDADHAAMRDAGVDVDADIMRAGDPVPPMFWFRDQDANTLLMVQRPAQEGQG